MTSNGAHPQCRDLTNIILITHRTLITLFKPIAMFYGTDNMMWNIPHIQTEEYYENYST